MKAFLFVFGAQFFVFFAYYFFGSALHAFLIPHVYSIASFLIRGIIFVFFYICLWMIFITQSTVLKKSQKIVAIGLIIFVTMWNGFFAFAFAIGDAMLGEAYASIQMPNADGNFAIARVSGLPEGEGFILYQESYGVFRKRIAMSQRWNSGWDNPLVKMYRWSELGRLNPDPEYLYDVEHHRLDIYRP